MATRIAPSSDIDLWSDANLREPFGAYAALRALGPVVHLGREGVYALTGYDAVRGALQDWRTFTSARGIMLTDEMNARAGAGVIMSDPPDHDRRRKVLNQQLVPRRMRDREEFVAARARELTASLPVGRPFDAVHDLGVSFSVSVVGDLVGLPMAGRERLVPCAQDAFDLWGPAGEHYDRAKPGFRELLDYVQHVVTPEHLSPGGWGAEIFGAGDSGDVSPEECPGIVMGYIHAGMDTTASAIASAVLLFGTNPDAWDAVRADRGLLPGAINEVVRLYSPVQRYTRCATVDTEIDGIRISAGDRVVVLIGAANRDPARFAEPDRFDIARPATDHVGFGFGVHHCAGAALARTELITLFGALADRVERFDVGIPQWGANAALHGLAELSVTLR